MRLATYYIILLLMPFGVLAQGFISFDSDTIHKIGLSSDSEIIVSSPIKNNTNKVITLKWKCLTDSYESIWDKVSVCDINTCYDIPYDESIHAITLNPNQSSALEVHYYPGGYSGIGTTELLAWVDGDSANTVVKSVFSGKAELASAIPAGIKQVVDIKVYPNPATSYLMFGNLPVEQDVTIEAYSILGKKMLTARVNVDGNPAGMGEFRLDLETLPKGVYMIRVYDHLMNVIHSESISRSKS